MGRKGCPEFAKLLAANNDTLPKGYKGAFEKHVEEFKKALKAKGGKVGAVTDAITDARMLELLAEEDDSDSDCEPRQCAAIWHTFGPTATDPFAVHSEYPPPSCDGP